MHVSSSVILLSRLKVMYVRTLGVADGGGASLGSGLGVVLSSSFTASLGSTYQERRSYLETKKLLKAVSSDLSGTRSRFVFHFPSHTFLATCTEGDNVQRGTGDRGGQCTEGDNVP